MRAAELSQKQECFLGIFPAEPIFIVHMELLNQVYFAHVLEKQVGDFYFVTFILNSENNSTIKNIIKAHKEKDFFLYLSKLQKKHSPILKIYSTCLNLLKCLSELNFTTDKAPSIWVPMPKEQPCIEKIEGFYLSLEKLKQHYFFD
jgi:hypothetical protein